MWRANSLYAMALAIAALFVIRLVLTQSAGTDAFRRRILVLGAGPRARGWRRSPNSRAADWKWSVLSR